MGCSDHTFPTLLYAPLRKYGTSKSEKTYEAYLQYKKKLMDTISVSYKQYFELFKLIIGITIFQFYSSGKIR